MLLMNILRLYTHWLPILFFISLIATGVFIFRSHLMLTHEPDYLSRKQQLFLVAATLAIGILFAGVRAPYLLESHLHHLVGPVVYDDTWHFEEINSLVNSARYPAQCSLIPNHYFSFYYAPWMLIAALYLAIPVDGFTIKMAFAIGCAIYQILICLTLLHIAMSRARTRTHLYWAMYLTGFWAGMESIFSLMYYVRRDGWWTMLPESPVHLPIFAVGVLWAIHHVSAAVALVLCWHLWETSEAKPWQTIAGCSMLISYASYASVFVCLGALPFGVFAICSGWSRGRGRSVLALIGVSMALIWPLLWLYLGKTGDVRFLFPFLSGASALFPFAASLNVFSTQNSPHLAKLLGGIWSGFFLFLLFIGLNFLPQTVALGFYGRRLRWANRALVLMAVAFLLSTYFVGFPEGDNYASRGYLIPFLVLSWICAGLLPLIRLRSWMAVALLLGTFGLLHEGIQTYRTALRISHTAAAGKYDSQILAINRSRHATWVAGDGVWNRSDMIYEAEKFVQDGKQNVVVADRQLECLGPRGMWRWQQIPGVSTEK